MTVAKQVLDHLALSGLDAADAKLLGITPLDRAATAKLFPGYSAAGFKLPYYDVNGAQRKDVYRVRLLESPVGSFATTKPLRYLQPKGSTPAAYFPRSTDWAVIAKDPTKRIVITEGEKKSACATKHGHPCIGLGGVSSWRSAKLGWSLLPELAAIEWAKRSVYICYDADSQTNPDVANAAAGLTTELVKRGALPRVVVLPTLDDVPKTGLDDFIVSEGADAFTDLLDETDSDDLSAALWEFNSRFAYVRNPSYVYDDQQYNRISPQKFHIELYSNIWAQKRILGPNGPRVKDVQVAKTWLDWPLRRTYAAEIYEPGQPRVVNDNLNCWTGWGVEPAEGDIDPWSRLLDHLFVGAEPEAREWFERWCLYPLAHPGAKFDSLACLWSKVQGVGKSTIGNTLGRVYGRNYALVDQRSLESDFNGWAVHKQFVMVDDVSAFDSRSKADILKSMVTRKQVEVNIKFITTFQLPDRCNYYLTSNHANAFYIEDEDRRYFVHEVTSPKLSTAFWDEYNAWLEGDGASALLWFAQRQLDFTGFHPRTAPPRTRAKEEMIDAVKSELDAWLTELRTEPASKLRLGEHVMTRDLWTATELLGYFDTTKKGAPIAVNTMGLRLRNYFKLADKSPLRPNGANEKFYVVRNEEKWLRAGRAALEDHVRTERAKERGAKGGRF